MQVLKSQFPTCSMNDMRQRRFNFKHCDDDSEAEPHLKITVQNRFQDKYHGDVDPLDGKVFYIVLT